MNQYLRIVVLSLVLTVPALSPAYSQGWKAHYRLAEKKMKRGDYYLAGYHYEAAYRIKNKKKLAYKAAEAYAAIKDFRRAANMYAKVLDYEKKYPFVRLKYARALKQSGEYEKAIREFVYFISHYKGADKEQWNQVVDREIEGCALGISYSDENSMGLLNVDLLPHPINSSSIEMAPIPVADDVLYFASLKTGVGSIFRTQMEAGRWSAPVMPDNFPSLDGYHYGSGSLSPDFKRFYFTKCANTGSLRAKCHIYVTVHKGHSWTEPKPLPQYINWENSTTTHPFVTEMDGKEYLFFASDRENGRGGLDLYVAERELSSEALDFTFPKNLGPDINTAGDEETPFYSADEEALYFSSNGHVSMGGLDVFKVKGTPGAFGQPVNLGAPVNSPADDLFFVKSSGQDRGYFCSNRLFGSRKISTTDEDIFSFHFKPDRYTVSGYVLDDDHRPMRNVLVTLYERNGNGELIYLTGRTFSDGHYKFPVRINKNYVLEVEKDGYPVRSVAVTTFGEHPQADLKEDIVLTASDALVTIAEVTTHTHSGIGASVTPAPRTPKNAAPASSGPVYKIKVTGTKVNADLLQTKYLRLKPIGTLEKNYIRATDTYWILLGDFATKKEAIKALAKVKNRGFKDATVIQYRNGKQIE